LKEREVIQYKHNFKNKPAFQSLRKMSWCKFEAQIRRKGEEPEGNKK